MSGAILPTTRLADLARGNLARFLLCRVALVCLVQEWRHKRHPRSAISSFWRNERRRQPSLLPELAVDDLTALRAFLSGRRTRDTSLAAQLDVRHDTDKQDTLLTWATRHGQAEGARLEREHGVAGGRVGGSSMRGLVQTVNRRDLAWIRRGVSTIEGSHRAPARARVSRRTW